MADLSAAVEELVLATLLDGNARGRRKRGPDWTLRLLAAACAAAGVSFVLFSLYQYLETLYRPDLAALGAGAGALIVGMALLLASRSRTAPPAPPPAAAEDGGELRLVLRGLIQDACKELEDPIRDNPKTSLLLSALAGFIMAENGYRL